MAPTAPDKNTASVTLDVLAPCIIVQHPDSTVWVFITDIEDGNISGQEYIPGFGILGGAEHMIEFTVTDGQILEAL